MRMGGQAVAAGLTAVANGETEIAETAQIFFEEAGENLELMERLLLGLDIAAAGDEDLNAIFRCAHSIKGGAASSFLVKPVVVQNGDAAPSAPAVSPNPAAGSSTDWILLLSDSGYEPTIGIPFAKGYQQDIYGPPVATHLLVWCIAAGSFNVIGQ